MMNIDGYIQHKVIKRQWGAECQFTVEAGGKQVNGVVPISSAKADDKELEKAISAYLAALPVVDSMPEKNEVETAVEAKEAEIKALLVSKGLLKKSEAIMDIKSLAELIASKVKDVK